MYFSKKMKRLFLKKIIDGDYDVYAIKLRCGVFADNEEELAFLVDAMFAAWRRIVHARDRGFLRHYDGIVKRLFFEQSKSSGKYSPFFYLLCARRRKYYSEEEYKVRIEKEKLRIRTYIRWFAAWASALKTCTNVSVGFSLVELEGLEKALDDFCCNEKYTLLALLDDAKMLLKTASGNGRHKLVTYHGMFKGLDFGHNNSIGR